MKPKVLFFNSLPSTNKKAFELAESGAEHGLIVQAGSQTAGRGRLGKSWQSKEKEGLYFSIIVRPGLDIAEYPKITMTTGVAVAEMIETISSTTAALKWPNDIYISGKKCCGILAEASLCDKNNQFCIIGIGINVLHSTDSFSRDIRRRATSIYLETGKRFQLNELLWRIWENVMTKIISLEKEGFRYILKEWEKRDYLHGKNLEWVTNGGKIISGISEGPDENGELLVRDSRGTVHKVISGDISLAR